MTKATCVLGRSPETASLGEVGLRRGIILYSRGSSSPGRLSHTTLYYMVGIFASRGHYLGCGIYIFYLGVCMRRFLVCIRTRSVMFFGHVYWCKLGVFQK